MKELKADIVKKEEEIVDLRKNVKNTRFFELDQELKIYKEEL